jgi:hypothetical protein
MLLRDGAHRSWARAGRAVASTALLGLILAGCSTSSDAPPPLPVTPIAPAAPLADAPPPPTQQASAEMVWALRSGLNVAALLCNNRSLTNNYNQMLKVHRILFNDVYAAEQARYRQLHGSAWQARQDVAMTRLYNGFASVPDRRRFCTMGERIAADVVAMPSAELVHIAGRALSALEPGAARLLSVN